MLLKIFLKTFSLLVFILFVFTANATNYYLANSGNDANSGTDPSDPWQTLNKLNSFNNLKPGDNVLFKRGDAFYGSITVSNSGTAGNPITFSAYGTGENPIITGFTNVTKWTNLGNNIWESTYPVSTLPTCNIVVVNGVNTAMGRWPNTGYLTYHSHTGNNSITSTALIGNTIWTGAEIVIRKNHFIIDRSNITSQSIGTLDYSKGSNYSPTNGFGFFIQNDIRTLDTANEWYYHKTTNKISIYSTISPNNLQASTVDTLISISGKSNLSFDNIEFTGSNANSIIIDNSNNIAILNCQFDFSGMDAVYAGTSSYLQISKSYFNHTNNNAISIGGVGATLKDSITNHILISEDTIKNTGIVSGMGKKEDEQTELTAILLQGSNNLIQNCIIDSTGYIPIWWRGNSSSIINNFITTFSFVKDDGGGIYCWNYDNNPFAYINQKILNNIILNGVGALEGSIPNPLAGASGLYFDGNAAGIEVEGNTISTCSDDGILFHDAHDIVLKNNTLYNNGTQIAIYSDYTPMVNGDTSFIRNLYVTNNIFVSKTPEQYNLASIISFNDISSFGIIDSNFYARPIDNNSVCRADAVGGGLHFNNYTFSSWQAYSGFDLHSSNSIKKITDTSDLRFEYNATMLSKTILLPFNYIDVRGTTYNGIIKLPPFSSAILIKNGAVINEPLKADAGSNQTITLPANSIKLSGSATTADGTVLSYLWTKISGPIPGVIANINSASTSVSGLNLGVYQFELKVTDNKGVAATDTIAITVNPQKNIPPNANGGPDKTITLPVSSTSLTGSATDTDGQILNYLWQKISGPINYQIINPNSSIANITGLTEGTYQFQLTVTDDKGAIAISTVRIVVNPPLNIPPNADAGADQIIILPTNKATLNGSGKDSDGTITSYLWTKISGPTACIISNASLESTTVKGLIQGKYVFRLTVTDNQGATATDSIQVTVTAAANTTPTADAGGDKTVTLPTNSISLSGSGNDKDGAISSYSWTNISGPSAYNISNSSSAVTSVSGLVQGVYLFELKVTDNYGAQAKDTLKITVNPAKNIPPVAHAGSNQTITLPTNTISLNGNGVDSDGTISTYLWIKIAGPATGTIAYSSSASTTVRGLIPGNYIFQLTVTDNQGAKGMDSIYVTVYARKNIAPTANAGGDLTIVLPLNTVYLNGSGNDTDGTITAYLWKQIAGPDSASIATDNKASTVVKNLVAGTYDFELTVRDNNEETGGDTVRVVVALGRISAEANSIKIYPNPIKDIAALEIISGNINSQLILIISDFAGKVVYEKQIISSDYKTTEKINMSTFSKGSYVLSVFFDEKDKHVSTIIKQ